MKPGLRKVLGSTTALVLFLCSTTASARAQNASDAILGDPGQRTAEISTTALKNILADNSAIVLDARPHLEFAISHIPGAMNVAAKPGVAASMYVSDVAEVGRLVNGMRRLRVMWPRR